MKQGEVWLINLEPTIRAEIKKTLQSIIVNDNKVSKESSADCFHNRSEADERLLKHLGFVSNEVMEKIRNALALVLNINYNL